LADTEYLIERFYITIELASKVAIFFYEPFIMNVFFINIKKEGIFLKIF